MLNKFLLKIAKDIFFNWSFCCCFFAGYAKTQGVSELLVGIMMALAASFGIFGTFMYPYMRRRLGLARTGIFGLSLQITCLVLCVVSVWMPGSKFDLFLDTNLNATNAMELSCIESKFSKIVKEFFHSKQSVLHIQNLRLYIFFCQAYIDRKNSLFFKDYI